MARRRRFYCSTRGCERQWKNVPTRACPSCGGSNTPVKRISRALAEARVYATPDIPEHFNVSLDCVVRGRRHLQQLQRERGCQDYEPQKYARNGYLNVRDGQRVKVKR